MLRFLLTLLGGFHLLLDGQPAAGFDSDKVGALLAFLAVESGRPHRRETLAGLLWPELTERRARRSLSQALYNLCTVIKDRENERFLIIITPQALQFELKDDCWLDVAAINAAARGNDPVQLIQVVDLYGGEFLQGLSLPDSFGFEEWMLLKREHMRRLASDILERLIGYHRVRGELTEALSDARRRLDLDPCWEDAHRMVMQLLAAAGQRSAALAQYETCRWILKNELDVQPEPQTKALCERIRSELSAAPSIGSLHSIVLPTHNLPAHLTPFVGREKELAELDELLEDTKCRLLTLVGPGGSGKTRLAIEVARRKINSYSHGVFFVPLTQVGSVGGFVLAIARAMRFTFFEGYDRMQQLVDFVQERQLLLLFDNFEHP